MNTNSNSRILLGALLLLPSLLVGNLAAAPADTALTYQGCLNDGGNAAGGIYDLRFTIYDALAGGNVIAGPLTNAATGVTNGYFTVTLDFGSVFDGTGRWLEIGVQTNGGSAFVTLVPRQPLMPAPYALYATNAGTAVTATTAASANSVAAANISGTLALSQLPPAVVSNNASGVTLAGTLSGNGAGLTSLNAGQVSSGTLADARLSANVALRNASQSFAGTNVFSSKVAIGKTAPATALDVNGTLTATGFVGNAASLTNLNGSAIQSGTIGTSQLATGAVTSAKFAGNTITAAKLASGIGIIPSGTFVLSATASNGPLMGAGFAPQATVLGRDWTQGTNAAAWAGRSYFGALTNNGQMWVLGGALGMAIGSTNDIWSSSNGVTWTRVTSAAPWPYRSAFGALQFSNQMWVMGGAGSGGIRHDVWSSSNGVSWTQATNAAGWSARSDFAAAAFNGQMWVMGGGNGSGGMSNDVWSSSDGAHWTLLMTAAPWSPRVGHTVLTFNGLMWLLGGYDLNNYFSDIWSATDGTDWVQVTNATPWGARRSFGAVVYNGRMWVLGGVSAGGVTYNDVWSSSNGRDWTQVTNAAPWYTRYSFGTLVYSNQLWLLGGLRGTSYLNDIWYSQPTFTNMLGSFYLYQKQ